MTGADGNGPIRAAMSGLSWPLRVDERGGLALADPAEDIDRSIWLVVSTVPGERRMRPDFGCRIWELLAGEIDERALGLAVESVREAITRWEPRVSLEDVHVDHEDLVTDEGIGISRVSVHVSYATRNTKERKAVGYERWRRDDMVQARLIRMADEQSEQWIGRLATGTGGR